MSEALQATLLPDEKIWEANLIARATWSVSSVCTEKAIAVLVKRLQEKGTIEREEVKVRELLGSHPSKADYYTARGLAKKIVNDTVIIDRPGGDFELFTLLDGHISYSKKKDSYTMRLNPAMAQFYMNLSEYFTVFSLPEFLELDGKYTQRLYHILKSWENCKNGYIDLNIDELKRKLNALSYPNYAQLNLRVLSVAKKEIERKTTMRFDYEPCEKSGRKITKLRFLFKSSPKYNKAPKKISH